jgi:hypothetical protein
MYEMRLATPRGQGGVEDVHGRLTVEWADVCEGWTVDQRMALVIDFGEDVGSARTLSTFASWESKDGLRFRFEDRTWHGDGSVEEIGGAASLAALDQPGEVRLTAPTADAIPLPAGTLFPTRHTLELIDRAAAGETYVVRQVYDGTTESASEVAAVIGALAATPEGAIVVPGGEEGWPMRLAFFSAEGRDDRPDYEIAVVLHANGVARDMVIDYGDYAIEAVLTAFEALPDPGC